MISNQRLADSSEDTNLPEASLEVADKNKDICSLLTSCNRSASEGNQISDPQSNQHETQSINPLTFSGI